MKIIFAAFLILSGSAQASNWHYMGETSDGRTFVEKESITVFGDIRKAWVSNVLNEFKYLPTNPPKPYLSTNSLLFFNCKERTSALSQVTYYSEAYRNGNVVETIINPKEQIHFMNTSPDSVGEDWLKFVCSQTVTSIR